MNKRNYEKPGLVRRIISLALSLALCVTMSVPLVAAGGSTANAATASGTELLVFGASTSSGYGLEDYVNNNISYNVRNDDLGYTETDTFGYKGVDGEWTVEAAMADLEGGGRISRHSYPWKLKQYIAKKNYSGNLKKVHLNAMTMNGMRSNELRALLDPDYYKKAYDYEYNNTRYVWADSEGNEQEEIGFLTRHIKNAVDALTDGGAVATDKSYAPDTEGYNTVHEYTQAQFKNADVIVLDIAMNNFGTYMAERIVSGFNIPGKENTTNYANQTINDITGVTDSILNRAKAMKEAFESGAGVMNDPAAAAIIDAFVYCYADCLTNFSETVKLVRQLNPDAKLVVLGIYNTLDGINLIVGDTKIDMGKVAAIGYNAMNAYLKSMGKDGSYYYFADTNSAEIETFMDQIGKAASLDKLIGADSKGNELSPGGKTLMDNLYNSFIEMFVGESNLDAMIEQTAESQFNAAVADETAAQGTLENARYSLNQLLPLMRNSKDESDPDNMTWADLYTLLDKSDTYINFLLTAGGIYEEGVMDAATIKAQVEGGMDAIRDGVRSVIKYRVQTVLFHAGKVTDINMSEVLSTMNSGTDAIVQELVGALQTGGVPGNSTLQVLHIVERFILYMAVGQHPDLTGCDVVYQCVRKAYDESVSTGGATISKTDNSNSAAAVVTLAKGKIRKLTASRKAIKVKWKTVANADGYQICLKAKGKKTRYVTVKGGKKVSKKVKKLAAKKKYKVKVRAYKTVNGNKIYGNWSKVKKIKTK